MHPPGFLIQNPFIIPILTNPHHPTEYMLRNFHSARFEVSAARLAQCPGASVPEVAFVGRSNAGKSSAINTLCNHRQLAYASRTPGRTQLINFFTVQYEGQTVARLVDLPGYGFAQLSKEEQGQWDLELGGYLGERPSLVGCVIVVDSRRGLLPLDWQMINWLAPQRTAVHIILSKSDKLTNQEKINVLRDTRRQLQPVIDRGQPATAQLWSSLKKSGLTELEDQLRSWVMPGSGPTDDEASAQGQTPPAPETPQQP